MQAYYIENAFWHSDATEDLKHSLVSEARRQGVDLLPRSNADFLSPDSFLQGPKAALFWDKDIRLASRMQGAGLRLFNSAKAIAVCDDKTLTWLALKSTGIAMPDTLLVPATFPNVGYEHADFLQQAADLLGLPMVIKEGCGSFGQQVYLVNTVTEARAILHKHAGAPLLMQRFIQESAGRDVRAYVVGGRVVASILRENNTGDFRASIYGGGTARPHALTPQEEHMALSACKALKLAFGGVDMLLSKDGPLLCEVNSNAHFRALRDITGIDPARPIITLLREACQA